MDRKTWHCISNGILQAHRKDVLLSKLAQRVKLTEAKVITLTLTTYWFELELKPAQAKEKVARVAAALETQSIQRHT